MGFRIPDFGVSDSRISESDREPESEDIREPESEDIREPEVKVQEPRPSVRHGRHGHGPVHPPWYTLASTTLGTPLHPPTMPDVDAMADATRNMSWAQ